MADRAPAADKEPSGQAFQMVVLAFCFVVAAFAIAAPIVLLSTPYKVMPAPFLPHKQNAETLLYVLTLVVFTPAAVLASIASVKRVASGPNRNCLAALVALLVVPLGFGLLLIRHSAGLPWGDGLKATLVLGVIWSVVAAGLLFLAARSKTSWLSRLGSLQRPLTWLAAAAGVAGAFAFIRTGHIDPTMLAIGLVVAAAVLLLYPRVNLPELSRGWRISIDVVALVLIAMAVPNMVILYDGSGDFDIAYRTAVSQFHQALFVGAASQVLDGSALLVDTVSQYGIGSIYLVAGFFEIVPIGFLTLGLLEGILSALTFALSYGLLRMSGVARPLAIVAMAIAVFTLAWGLLYPIGALLQHGYIRYGLPVLLLAAVTAGARWPGTWRWMRWVALAVTGLSSIWALEAFIYTGGALAGLLLIGLVWQEKGQRLRWFIRTVAAIIGSWVVVQVLFAVITLAAVGSLPDWGMYLTYLREFLGGEIGDLTYDVTQWSPSLGIFAIYVVSAIGMASLAAFRPQFVQARKPAFLALAGITGYGAVLFSYFVNRSLDHILIYECLPALLVVTIWLGLALERNNGLTVKTRTATLAAALALAVVVVSTTWHTSVEAGKDSMLAYAIPGGKSLGDGFDRIFNPPEFKPGAESGAELIDRYVPEGESVAVVTAPDLDVEILARADRANRLRITDAKESSWVPGPHLPGVEEGAGGLEAGDVMVVDRAALEAFQMLESDPKAVFDDPLDVAVETELQIVQIKALALIAERFKLRKLAAGERGIEIVELVKRPTQTGTAAATKP